MPRKYRISRAEFGLMRGFKRLSGVYFSLSYGVIPGRPLPGGAIIVSSKAAPSAAARNRVRRRGRAILVEILEKVTGGAVFALHARKGSERASSELLRTDIVDLMARARPAR
jgi:RNase P protein component